MLHYCRMLTRLRRRLLLLLVELGS
jgi:hypothetical protein